MIRENDTLILYRFTSWSKLVVLALGCALFVFLTAVLIINSAHLVAISIGVGLSVFVFFTFCKRVCEKLGFFRSVLLTMDQDRIVISIGSFSRRRHIIWWRNIAEIWAYDRPSLHTDSKKRTEIRSHKIIEFHYTDSENLYQPDRIHRRDFPVEDLEMPLSEFLDHVRYYYKGPVKNYLSDENPITDLLLSTLILGIVCFIAYHLFTKQIITVAKIKREYTQAIEQIKQRMTWQNILGP